ncbi:uracil-DNA glycosylase [Subtercola boreus]|nr:uracil-DNA glycosylase [Subtercola boreus]
MHAETTGVAGMPSKLARLEERHVAALNGLVRQLRTTGGSPRVVPWADPDSGGVDARVLVLFESPANLTVSAGASAFSSEDNENATSRSFAAARIEAGMTRRDYLRWNVVPWPLFDAAGVRRPPNADDLDEAQPALAAVIELMPGLSSIVTFGATALTAVMRYYTLHDHPVIVPVLAAPHPSPANGHRRGENHVRAVNALRRSLP